MAASIDQALKTAKIDPVMAEFEGGVMSKALRQLAYEDDSQLIELITRRPLHDNSMFRSRTLIARTPYEESVRTFSVEYSSKVADFRIQKHRFYIPASKHLEDERIVADLQAGELGPDVVQELVRQEQQLYLLNSERDAPLIFAGEKELKAAAELLGNAIFLRPEL